MTDGETPAIPRALTALGPAYVKFGQILSTRPDICGAEIARDDCLWSPAAASSRA